MVVAGLFAGLLLLTMIVLDWFHFTSLTTQAVRYGYEIARRVDRVPQLTWTQIVGRFDHEGVLDLPHGVARLFHEEQRISFRPKYRLFSARFRTAWPLKGLVEVRQEPDALTWTYIKRIPWSSAVLTMLWFGLVGLGTVWFVIAFVMEGGFQSLGSALLGLGIVGIGVLVLFFGLITVALAYRLEDHRLGQVHHELCHHLTDVADVGAPTLRGQVDSR
ncbi:MAG: hypothetical protein ACREI3_02350 [Nitrospirales bacterium]